jgi:hypothetical protein
LKEFLKETRTTISWRWKQEWTGYAILVVVLRLIYAVIGVTVIARGGPVELAAPLYGILKPYLKTDLFSQWIVNPWYQWDTISYLRIAILGYGPDESIAFMPLYPLLVRFASPLFGNNHLLAALSLSTLLCFMTLVLLHELLIQLYPEQVASKAVILFITFPTAFFLLAGYTESLFMVLVLAFWMLARKKRWWWATLFASLATLTRLQGVILAPVLLWMMFLSLVEQPATSLIGQTQQILAFFANFQKKIIGSRYKFAWLAVFVPITVSMLYQSWLYNSELGEITKALEKYWLLKTVMPWEGFTLFLKRLFVTKFIYMDWIDLILFAIVLAGSVIALRLIDPAFSLYVWLTLAVLLTRGTPPHLLASYSRYFLALFPLFIVPAMIRNRYFQVSIVAVSFILQILLVWIFLGGSWVA